jgi:uncharacterized cupredoxin-like copper-binding protein
MHSRVVVVLVAVGMLLAACTAGGVGSTPSAQPSTSSAPSGSAATRIEVTLTDALKIEPATMSVPAGVPVTFVVTNSGATEHEFYLGDEAAQAEHEQEMQAGGMMHDDPNGISLAAGETKELTHTFNEAGETLAGCHVAGHYPGGMKATITVTG